MTEEVENAGVEENVADSQVEAQQQDDQQINWQKAQEALAEQKRSMEELKQQNMTYQQQLQVFQNHLNQQNQPQAVSSEVHVADDDLVTGADFKKALDSKLTAKEKELQGTLTEMQTKMKMMEMRAQYSDYDSVIKNTLEMAKTDPALAEAIQTSSNPHLLAYQLGRGSVPQKTKQSVEAQKMVENAQKPGSINQASTGGSALSKVDFFAGLSDREFEKHIASVKRGS